MTERFKSSLNKTLNAIPSTARNSNVNWTQPKSPGGGGVSKKDCLHWTDLRAYLWVITFHGKTISVGGFIP